MFNRIDKKLDVIRNIAYTSVNAAAQIGDIGDLTNVDRKAKAVEVMKSLLDKTSINLSEYDVSNIIEAIYREFKSLNRIREKK